jgi:glycosyltransferase involved in cell wall biosynthesis
MRVLHILTSGIFPMPGGLEMSVLRIARALTVPGHSQAIVYTRRQPREFLQPDTAHGPVQVVHLGVEKAFLMAPISGAMEPATESVPSAWLLESLRVDYLLLVSAIQEKMNSEPECSHILISFFMTTNGFIAQQAAFALGIPHIASVQGSDFSRDFRSPYHLQAIRFVVENARFTITNNREQARILAAAFPAARPFHTIYNALEEEIASESWTPSSSATGRLAADCEFSFKKGTHILLRAVADICRLGEPVRLTVAGRIEAKEKNFWEECQRDYMARFPGVFSFPGWLAPDRLHAALMSSEVYVSATLGEGCSLAQMRAMALGMPMVATRTGALVELCGQAAHVRLCAPGNVSQFTSEVRSMLAGLRNGTVQVDMDRVHQWRRLFTVERERRQWEEVVSEL